MRWRRSSSGRSGSGLARRRTRRSPTAPGARRRSPAPPRSIAGADQLLVNGAPLLVVAVGTRDGGAVGLVFAATMLVRAPVYVFQGFAASLLPNLTHLAAVAGRAQLRRAVLRTALVLFAVGMAFIGFAAAAGPAAMRARLWPELRRGRDQPRAARRRRRVRTSRPARSRRPCSRCGT